MVAAMLPEPDLEIDAIGLLCPLPVLWLRKRIAGLPAGQVVRLLATDPAAEIDVPHFAQEAGVSFLGTEPGGRDGATAYYLRV
ncbi:MAG: sulfurtransferase TusA family protein [Pseudomonadota bacterium]